MGVVRTDKWLDKLIHQPVRLCKLAMEDLENADDFYAYLCTFGMYTSARRAAVLLKKLKEQKVWDKIDLYYRKYREKWKGPAVTIYIFPIDSTNPFFMRHLKGRSGIAFSDKMFLFLSGAADEKQWESLFIHEYHHVTRMHAYKKNKSQYTLLDSLVFEGLAEYAVLGYCGKKYQADFKEKYPEKMLKNYWLRFYKPHLETKRCSDIHNDLLLGRRRIPTMMGYAIGDQLVNGYLKKNRLRITETFTITSEKLLHNNAFIADCEEEA